MNDSEFLELLNLYLDHEISAADAARLEAEVKANPARRQVYDDYCRMQKACTVLAKDFAEQRAERNVLDFDPRRPAWASGLFAVGGLAAAACVALVVVNRTRTAAPDATSPVQTIAAAPAATITEAVTAAPVPASPATPIVHMVTAVPERRNEARALLASVPLTLATANATNAEALMAAAQQNAQAQFEWMRNVQFAPVQQLPLDELRLDARSPLQPASRTYSSGHPVQGTVEMTAFKFQK